MLQPRFPAAAHKRRDLLFKAAGISRQDEADLLKKAFDTNAALLNAEKLEVRVLDDGTVVTVPVPDNQVRQRAVESVFDVVGAKRNTKGDGESGGSKLVLVLPDYYSPEFLKQERKPIDVTATTMESTPNSSFGPASSNTISDAYVSEDQPDDISELVDDDDAESVVQDDSAEI